MGEVSYFSFRKDAVEINNFNTEYYNLQLTLPLNQALHMRSNTEQIIQATQNWVRDVVIGCGFCPFANKVFIENSIRYAVIEGTALHEHTQHVLNELVLLMDNPSIETSLVIFPDAYEHFSSYLSFLKQCEKLSARKGYEGVFQIASFHPQYLFGDTNEEEDPANFTNRSPYPMLHLIREESLSKAISFHPDPEGIPQRNIEFARSKGIDYMKQLLQTAKQV